MNFCNCHTHTSTNPDWEILSPDFIDLPTHFHSIGIHPWKVNEINREQLEDVLLAHTTDKTVAIGEIGLDRLKGPDLDLQIAVFEKQIDFSEKVALPVILHCVKAWNELIVVKRKKNPKQTWIYHGFNKANLLEEVLKEHVVISIGTAIFENAKLQNVVAKIPNEMLLLETDDSAISIEKVYEKVAEIKGITLVLLREIIEQNCKRIFPKWHIG
ncbi:MAG: TatD family hydrolase [Crocinitomicaceae bacterium]